jgi:membrane-associated phospholipid phosphatase
MSQIGWLAITQFGNSMLLLPAALVLFLWMLADHRRSLALTWAVCFGFAVLLVLASKLAFLGWGFGIRALDFTGFSGHSTVSTAVFPMLAYLLSVRRGAGGLAIRGGVAVALGLAVGVIVSVSRLVLAAHSESEVVAGFLLGGWAALCPIWIERGKPNEGAHRWVGVAVLVALMLAPQAGRPAEAHGIVVKLALWASGRSEPFTRETWSR